MRFTSGSGAISGRAALISTFALAAVMASGAGTARADARSFMALFEPEPAAVQYPAGAEEMTASYDDGRDNTRVEREYPSATREIMPDPTEEKPGTITVDTTNRYLYLSLPNGQAVRYGVGVGREGFTWKGVTRIGRKEAWPDWTPPKEMLKRRPDLPRHMAGGKDNPLGARAMYLYSGDRDTMFRIHGSNEPWSIGEAVSSGCIRMLNDDVADLFSRVRVGTTVKVL
jgi:lipoprotein-anchoring transpeptidase ErfK/SrfK